MAKQKKRKSKNPQKKSKSTTSNWSKILINALIDLLIGTLLILIGKMMD